MPSVWGRSSQFPRLCGQASALPMTQLLSNAFENSRNRGMSKGRPPVTRLRVCAANFFRFCCSVPPKCAPSQYCTNRFEHKILNQLITRAPHRNIALSQLLCPSFPLLCSAAGLELVSGKKGSGRTRQLRMTVEAWVSNHATPTGVSPSPTFAEVQLAVNAAPSTSTSTRHAGNTGRL